jgi:hypothetical protein
MPAAMVTRTPSQMVYDTLIAMDLDDIDYPQIQMTGRRSTGLAIQPIHPPRGAREYRRLLTL